MPAQIPHGSRPRTRRSWCTSATTARRRRRSGRRRDSWCGSGSPMCAPRTTRRRARAAPSVSSMATSSSRRIRTAGTSASTRWRTTMATTTTTDTSGFDLTLSEEQQLVQRTARDFAREKVLPQAAAIDEDKKIPRELIDEMGRLGFMGIDVPERYGGSGMDRLTYMLVVEEINR